MSNSPLTVAFTKQNSPDLIRSEIDSRIVKIRPSSTPLDQISRIAGGRHARSMRVDYYAVETKNSSTKTDQRIKADTYSYSNPIEVKVVDASIFSVSETVVFPKIKINDKAFVAYIKEINDKVLTLIPLDSSDSTDEISDVVVPEITSGTIMVRMGRAAGELDVQTALHLSLPTKKHNFCQIFKTQVEESFYHRLADKEVGWSFSDQEEMAVVDMRLGIEKSYLFGQRCRLKIDDNEEVLMTGGIWNQTTHEYSYTPGEMTNETIIDMMREAFALGQGSTRKILVAGSDLIESLNKLEANRVLSASDKETVWGIDFHLLTSKFGSLYVVRSEVFDLCDMAGYGMVIDPEYITKYTHVPFTAERISFRSQGVRNTEGVVLTEASCLVLRCPSAHLKIVAN